MNPRDLVAPARRALLDDYVEALRSLNRTVNLVSRPSAAHVEEHVDHCLTLALRRFPAGSTVVDWGSGGGLPAIPLAICFADVTFVAVDSVRRKTDAVRVMSRQLGIDNVETWNGRAEAWPGVADFAVSRGTARLDTLWTWTKRILVEAGRDGAGRVGPGAGAEDEGSGPAAGRARIVVERAPAGVNASDAGRSDLEYWSPGLVCLKGGPYQVEALELGPGGSLVESISLERVFGRGRFSGKYIVCVGPHERT